MTVDSTTSRMPNYTGNGATATYAYTFKIFSDDDLVVTVRDTASPSSETTLTKTTDYTVTGVGEESGGNVVLVNASQAWLTGGFLTTGYKLCIRRKPALLQEESIRNQGSFLASVHEDALDLLTMEVQSLRDEVDRSVRIAECDPALTERLGDATARASKYVGFDVSGEPALLSAPAGTTSVSSFGASLIDDADASTALSTLGVSTYIKTLLDDADAATARNTLGATAGVWPETDGGTGKSSYAVGDLLYADTTTTLAKLPKGTSGQVLTQGSSIPSWATPNARNLLLNSDFSIWQRGTSTTVANAATAYQADRWYAKNSLGTNGVITYSRVSGSSDGALYGAKLLISTAPTAAQANGCELYQTLENFASLPLYNKTASFTVKVKAFGNVNQVGVQFFYKTTEAKVDTAIGSETLTTVNTSTFTDCTINGQAIGTSQTTAGVIGVRVRITGVSSGNTYDLNNGFSCELAMLNEGNRAAAHQRAEPSMAGELASCRRFYQKSYAFGTDPGTATTVNVVGERASGTSHQKNIDLRPTMRATPTTITLYNPNSSNTTGSWYDSSGAANRTATKSLEGDSNFTVNMASTVDGNGFQGHWIADAEI